MMIDAHCHAFLPEDIEGLLQKLEALDQSMPDDDPHKWRLDMGGTLEDVVAAQKRSGVDRFVLLPVTSRPDRVAAMNRWAADQAAANPLIIAFASLLPGCDVAAELELIAELGLRGIKLHPFIQRFRLDDPGVDAMFSLIEGSGLPVLIDTLQDRGLVKAKPHMEPFIDAFGLHGCEAGELADMAEAHPGINFIAAHGGSCYGWEEIARLNALPNVYYDISWIGYLIPDEEVVRIIRGKGADKVIYGSDAPFREPEKYLEWFRGLDITADEREWIAGRAVLELLESSRLRGQAKP